MDKQNQYLPIRISDPKTCGTIVKLHTCQDLIVSITGYDPQISVASDHLVCEKHDECTFVFRVKEYVQSWFGVNSIYLGNIKGTDFSLILMLEPSKTGVTNQISVVGSKNAFLKLKPYQLLEVVLFDGVFANWNVQWQPGDQVDLEYLYHSQICARQLSKTDLGYIMQRRNCEPVVSSQSHFWFCFSDSVLDQLSQNDVLFSGSLIISAKKPDATKIVHKILITVDCKEKYRSKTIQTLTRQEIITPSKAAKPLASAEVNVVKNPGIVKTLCEKDVELSLNYDDWEANCTVISGAPDNEPNYNSKINQNSPYWATPWEQAYNWRG